MDKIRYVLCGGILLIVLVFGVRPYVWSAYEDAAPAYVVLNGNVSLQGDKTTSDIEKGMFQFKVESLQADIQLPDRTIDAAGGGKVNLGSFTFPEAGTYLFKVKQIDKKQTGYTYDLNEVTVTVTVTYNRGTDQMEAVISCQKAGQNTAGITFANTYRVPADTISQPAQPREEPQVGFQIELPEAGGQVVPGQELTYGFAFTNTGDQELAGLYARIYVPEECLFLTCDETGSYGAIDGQEHATWFIEQIRPGETVRFELTFRVNLCVPDDLELEIANYYEVTGNEERPAVNEPENPRHMRQVVYEVEGVTADGQEPGAD